MPERFLKIRQTYWDDAIKQVKMCEDIIVINLDKVLMISYSKNEHFKGDYVSITFENSSIVGMVVN